LVITQFPTAGTAGVALAPATKVIVLDQFGNLVTATTGVTLTLSSGTFSNGMPTMSANSFNGTATFSSVIINTAGSCTISASSGTLAGSSFRVTINPAAASKVVFLQAPPPVWTGGMTLTPAVVVGVEDKFGNLVTTDNSSPVTLTLNTGTFSTGSKTATVTAIGGTATFSNLIINTGGTYLLTATDRALTSAVSGSIAIGLPAGAPSLVRLERIGNSADDLAAPMWLIHRFKNS
jgi:hypothetical protein